jgi:hypothetical protein
VDLLCGRAYVRYPAESVEEEYCRPCVPLPNGARHPAFKLSNEPFPPVLQPVGSCDNEVRDEKSSVVDAKTEPTIRNTVISRKLSKTLRIVVCLIIFLCITNWNLHLGLRQVLRAFFLNPTERISEHNRPRGDHNVQKGRFSTSDESRLPDAITFSSTALTLSLGPKYCNCILPIRCRHRMSRANNNQQNLARLFEPTLDRKRASQTATVRTIVGSNGSSPGPR